MWIGTAEPYVVSWKSSAAMARVIAPTVSQVLDFCAEDPVERVFLEEVARRRLGRFTGLEEEEGRLVALCHGGANVVPSGRGCGALASTAIGSGAWMVIGEERAVDDLWKAGRGHLPRPRADRPGQPVYAIRESPAPGGTGLRAAVPGDLPLLVPACAVAHEEELGVDPLARDAAGFRRRTESQILEGRSWIWVDGGRILFKAEASAWTPAAVQLQQVWVDPEVRRLGHAKRGLADLCGQLLERVPAVCLFARRENIPAIRLYQSVGMERVLTYRSILF
jgi:GNAT superfamily N-acetyltransferase